MSGDASSRRDFLRGLFGKAANVAREGLLPESVALPGAAAAAGSEPASPRAPTPDEMRGAFAVPSGQEDIAERLVASGRLLRAPDGRVTEPAFAFRVSLPPLGTATERWLDRTRGERFLDPTRPQDAILLHAVREELAPR